MDNIIIADFSKSRDVIASGRYQYDYGQIYKPVGVELPDNYEVHFGNEFVNESYTVLGNADGALVPDVLFTTGLNILAWIFLHDGTDDGRTVYRAYIPIARRSAVTDTPPTPEEQSAITQAIALLNTAVERTSADVGVTSENARQAVSSAQSAAQSETNALSYAERAETARDTVVAATDRAETAATNARASEVNAKESEVNAINAADRAEQAAAEAGYMFFYIDSDGHLRYQRTSNVVDVDFYLDDGHLYVKGVS